MDQACHCKFQCNIKTELQISIQHYIPSALIVPFLANQRPACAGIISSHMPATLRTSNRVCVWENMRFTKIAVSQSIFQLL